MAEVCHLKLSSVIATEHYWSPVNISNGDGLEPSGNRTLPEPVLIEIRTTIQPWGVITDNDLNAQRNDWWRLSPRPTNTEIYHLILLFDFVT